MASLEPSGQDRLTQLSEQVRVLTARVDELADRLNALSPKTDASRAPNPQVVPLTAPGGTSAAISVPGVFSAVATTCFLLVVALILRILTDNKIVNQQVGTSLGLAYVAFLVCYGYRRRMMQRPLSALYVTCGALLLFSIVIETYLRFHVLSAEAAYLLLGTAAAAMTFLGVRSKSAVLVHLAVVGATLAGLVLDFPQPVFALLGALLFCLLTAAYAGGAVRYCAWIKWPVLFIALFFWLTWTLKGRIALLHPYSPPTSLTLAWFLPELCLFLAASVAMVAAAAIRKGGAIGAFETAIPPLAAVAAAAALYVVSFRYYAAPAALSAAGAAFSAIALALAFQTARAADRGGWAAPSLALTALLPLPFFVPGCLPGPLTVLPVCAVAAVATAAVSPLARNRIVTVVSHLFQTLVCIIGLGLGILLAQAPSPVSRAGLLAALGGLCLAHYAYTRKRPPGAEPFDAAIYTAVFPLLAALVYVFGVIRISLFHGVEHFQLGAGMFEAGQSVSINAGVLIVAAAGLLWRHEQLLAAALVVALAGAAKVFGYDLSHLHGIPVVLSVFSFGATAAFGPALWRWRQRQTLAEGSRNTP